MRTRRCGRSPRTEVSQPDPWAHGDAAAPEHYAPQYGGYCAWAVSQGYTASIDPGAWTIVDGKLYLNFSKDVEAKWREDAAGHIAAADRNWPRVLD